MKVITFFNQLTLVCHRHTFYFIFFAHQFSIKAKNHSKIFFWMSCENIHKKACKWVPFLTSCEPEVFFSICLLKNWLFLDDDDVRERNCNTFWLWWKIIYCLRVFFYKLREKFMLELRYISAMILFKYFKVTEISFYHK